MAKIKSLTELSDLYSNQVYTSEPTQTKVKEFNEILLTDATNYLPKGSAPKVGEGFGKEKEELAKNTGPQAADNFKKVDEKQDPGSSKKVMKKVEDADSAGEKEEDSTEKNAEKKDHKDEKKTNIHQEEAAKQTLPKEKLQEEVETASKTTKYNKPTFTMSKSKFDKLYEDAINGVPFVKEDEATPVAPVDDMGGDMGGDEPAPDVDAAPEGEEVSHTEIIDMLEKVLAALKKHAEQTPDVGAELGGADMDAGATPAMEDEDPTMDEAVDAEDLGHPGPGHGAKSEQLKDGHKIHKVGALKAAGAASEQSGPKGGDGTVQKAKDFDKGLQKPTGNNQAGNLKVSKGTGNAFE